MKKLHQYSMKAPVFVYVITIVIQSALCLPPSSPIIYMPRIRKALDTLKHQKEYKMLKHFGENFIHELNEGKVQKKTTDEPEPLTVPEAKPILTQINRLNEQIKHNEAAINDRKFVLDHPVNTLRFVRNNTQVLDQRVQDVAKVLLEAEQAERWMSLMVTHANLKHTKIFQNYDVNKTMHRLLVYQYTHKLRTAKMARGLVHRYKGQRLTAQECLEVARYARTTDSLQLYAATWMETARTMVQHGDTSVKMVTLLKKSINMYKSWGGPCMTQANDLYAELLSIRPNTKFPKPEPSPDQPDNKNNQSCLRYINKPKMWNQRLLDVCQGEDKKHKTMYRKHKMETTCQLANKGYKLMLSKPIKQEIVSYKPYIFIIHDVISTNESKQLKEIGITELQLIEEKEKNEDFLIKKKSYAARLPLKYAREIGQQIQKKLAKVSSLGKKTFNDFVITKYTDQTDTTTNKMALFDISHTGEDCAVRKHNTTGSIFVYLKAPEAGGETAFPMLGIKVKPVAHAALFVDYMLPDGTWDHNAMHGSCPVIKGEKWVGVQTVKDKL